MFGNLFSPLQIGQVTIPNRICFMAHRTNFSEAGRLTKRQISYYKRRAQGGCGLVILGELAIDPDDRPWEKMVHAFSEEIIPDYQKLAAAIHEQNCKLFAQLCHYGFQSSSAITRHVTLGPSATSDIVFGETCKAMESEDLNHVVNAFAQSALLVKQGGFDGVMIDLGPTSLLRQFLSPISNFRQDMFGGSLENRLRYPLLVIKTIRGLLGNTFPIGIELCADEMFYGGINSNDSRQIARVMIDSGNIDCISVTVGTYYNLHLVQPTMQVPADFSLAAVQAIKSESHLPVLAGHQAGTPEPAEKIIASGQADAIGLTRALICDPDLPQKAFSGRLETIRVCARDNKGCVGRINQSKTLSCVQNPAVGHESDHRQISPDSGKTGKRVMVIGAGPAGMEAARTARLRNHQVTIYEKQAEPGGLINICKRGAGRQPMAEIGLNLKRALHDLQVPIILETCVTPELVLKENPEVVIVATGSNPLSKPILGDYSPPAVLTVPDVLLASFPVGQKVLIIENNRGRDATATARLLAEQGKQVTIITSELFVGVDLATVGDLYLIRQVLLKLGVTFITDTRIEAIRKQIVYGHNIFTNAAITFENYDTIILDLGYKAEDRLYKDLKGQVKCLHRIGDCVAPRGIELAILEGRRIGEAL